MKVNAGDTAWVLASAALVLFMTTVRPAIRNVLLIPALLVVALVAQAVPIVRAMRVDPSIALRQE